MTCFRRQPHRSRSHFTLPEVVAVVFIIGLVSSLALPLLRSPSPSTKLEQTALKFEVFCSRVRYQAMENGKDRIVAYDPAAKLFFMREVEDENESVISDRQLSVTSETADIKWKLPEDYECNQGNVYTGQDHIDIFRFYPDGGACALSKLRFNHGKFTRVFEISMLTGTLRSREPEEGEEVSWD